MGNHLARRGGIWWVRLVVPQPLRELAGRREFTQSTHTHEFHIAKLVASTLLVEWRQKLLRLEVGPVSAKVLKLMGPAAELAATTHVTLKAASETTGVEISQLLNLASRGKLRLYCRVSHLAGYEVPLEDLEYDDPELGLSGGIVLPSPQYMPSSASRAVMNGVLAIPKFEFPLIANSILTKELKAVDISRLESPSTAKRVFLPNDSFVVPVEHLEVQTAVVLIVQRHIQSQITNEQVERALELEKHVVELPTASASIVKIKLFSEALEAYALDPTGLPKDLASSTEQRQRKRGCQLFLELVGDLPLNEINAIKLREFRDGSLRTVPAKLNNLPKELKGKDIKETIAIIRESGVDWPLMSQSRQAERMQWLSKFFAWCANPAKLISSDPSLELRGETGLTKAERVELKRQSDEEDGREPFTSDELNSIFNQTWFQTGSGAHFKKPRIWYPFEYWLPLLGAFAGCRIGEACQLRLTDICQHSDGIWYFDINRATSDKSLKNDQSKRIIPVHPKLVELGLIEYCKRLEKEGFQRLFPELSLSQSDARYAKEPIRRMSAMLKNLGMPRDSMRVFHCLRHNMNNGLMRVPMALLPFADENLKKYIRYRVLGHKPGSDVNTKHYTRTTPEEMHSLVAGLTYDLPEIRPIDIDFSIAQVWAALNNKDGDRRGREDMGS